MLDITGAGTQRPMRSHWKLRPARSHTKTASSNASATGQAQPQQTAEQALQGKKRVGIIDVISMGLKTVPSCASAAHLPRLSLTARWAAPECGRQATAHRHEVYGYGSPYSSKTDVGW